MNRIWIVYQMPGEVCSTGDWPCGPVPILSAALAEWGLTPQASVPGFCPRRLRGHCLRVAESQNGDSNCLDQTVAGSTHAVFFCTIAFIVVSNLRMQATSATFFILPAASNFW